MESNYHMQNSASLSTGIDMDDSATIFIAESQDMNLDYEIADEALEAVAQFGGGCPTLLLYLRQRTSRDKAD